MIQIFLCQLFNGILKKLTVMSEKRKNTIKREKKLRNNFCLFVFVFNKIAKNRTKRRTKGAD